MGGGDGIEIGPRVRTDTALQGQHAVLGVCRNSAAVDGVVGSIRGGCRKAFRRRQRVWNDRRVMDECHQAGDSCGGETATQARRAHENW